MSRVETAPVGKTVSWLPPLDGGTLLMAVLIGAMGFYILYPLALILLNSFNVATIAEPPAYGLQAWKDAFSEAGLWPYGRFPRRGEPHVRRKLAHHSDPHYRAGDDAGDCRGVSPERDSHFQQL